MERGQWIPVAVWLRAALFLALGLVIALVLLAVLWLAARPLALLLAAIVLAEAVEPAVAALDRRWPRAAAVATVYLGLAGALAALGWFIFTRLAGQLEEVLAGGPPLAQRAQDLAGAFGARLGIDLRSVVQTWVSDLAATLPSLPQAIISGALGALLIAIMSAYWAAAQPTLRRFGLTFVPRERERRARAVAGEAVKSMGGYVRARAILALVVGAVVYGGLLLIGVPFSLPLALLAAVGEFIPFIGPIVATAAAALVALGASSAQAVIVVLFYTVLQQLKSNFLMPYLAREQAEIPPLLVVFAVLAGGSIGGVLGALVAPPLAGGLRILFLKLIAPEGRGWRRMADDASDSPS